YNIPIDVKNITPGQVLTYDGEKISGKENDASAGKLGPAPDPDGLYGEPDGNGPGVEEGDSVESAIDKIIDFLDLTAPPKPQDLSQKTFTVPNLFSARREGTLSNVTNITYETSPVIIVTGSDDGLFYDGKSGELTATVYDGNADRTETNRKELTNYDYTTNSGSGGILFKITADNSFNSIWKGLKAIIQSPSNLEAGPLAQTYTIL